MGSRKRQEAIASGKIVETAEARRRRARAEATYLREEIAITMIGHGKKVAEIEEELQRQTGSRCHGNVLALARRGLYRRAQENKHDIEAAKEALLAYYRPLLEVYLPRALGEVIDPDTGLTMAPDTRAADLALKVLDKIGQVTGALLPPRAGDVNLHLQLGGQAPPDADSARRMALEAVERERAKHKEIEGQLADTPAVDGTTEATGDEIPPPFDFDLPATPA